MATLPVHELKTVLITHAGGENTLMVDKITWDVAGGSCVCWSNGNQIAEFTGTTAVVVKSGI